VVVLPDPFRGMGAWRNSTETQQSGHASRSGPEVKSEVVPKMAHRRGPDATSYTLWRNIWRVPPALMYDCMFAQCTLCTNSVRYTDGCWLNDREVYSQSPCGKQCTTSQLIFFRTSVTTYAKIYPVCALVFPLINNMWNEMLVSYFSRYSRI